MKYILHIGTHKTASTLIQSFLAANQDLLLAQGIDFPVICEAENGPKRHHELVKIFKRNRNGDAPAFNAAHMAGLSGAPVVIISAEGFYRCFDESSLSGISSVFNRDSRVICYLREPVSHIISFYKQIHRGGHATLCLQDLIDLEAGKLNLGKGYYVYDASIEAWRRHFPDLVIEKYRRMDSQALISRFFELCKVSVDLNGMKSPRLRNISPSDEMCALLRSLNLAEADNVISPRERTRWAHFITSNASACQEIAERGLVSETVEVSEFLEVFDYYNPNSRRIVGPYTGKMSFSMPSAVDMDAREFIEHLQDIQVSREKPNIVAKWRDKCFKLLKGRKLFS